MKMIVAVDENWGIGHSGEQLCYISEDLKRFKKLTSGHTVLLGRKTLATFPGGKPLKNRRNLILSHQPDLQIEGAEVYHTLEAALEAAPEDTFSIGGASVYRQTLPFADTVYVTKIHRAFPADRYFPDLDGDPAWERIEAEGPFEQEGLFYSYVTYRRSHDEG